MNRDRSLSETPLDGSTAKTSVPARDARTLTVPDPNRPMALPPEAVPLVEVIQRVHHEDKLLAELATETARLSEVDAVDILLKTGNDSLVLRATTIAPEYVGRLRIGKGIGVSGQVLTRRERMVIQHHFSEHPHYTRYPGYEELYESAIVEPLWLDGDVAGVVLFRNLKRWRPGARQIQRIEALTQGIAFTLKTFRTAFLAGNHDNRIGALSEVTSIITNSPYLEEILQLLVNMTAQQFGYRVCTVRLLDAPNQELVLRATQATVKAYQRKRAIRLGESIAGKALVERQTIVVPDVQVEEDYIGHDLAVEQGLRSMICVPLAIRDRPVGVLTCYTSELHEFDEDEIRALETLAQQAALSIEHAKLQVRSTLMQEMHHRVKNNLQQVVSLLRLQLRHSHYRSIEEAINDSLSRILAIASVHDLLSREDLDHVGVRGIAEALVHHQQQSFVLPDRRIEFSVRGEDVRLNMNQATQVALILNELIQNAVEHGFATINEGEIHINIETQDLEVLLWVSNNGDALPPGFDFTVASNLGLQIVANLSRSLGGSFTIQDKLTWTVAEVRFTRSTSE